MEALLVLTRAQSGDGWASGKAAMCRCMLSGWRIFLAEFCYFLVEELLSISFGALLFTKTTRRTEFVG